MIEKWLQYTCDGCGETETDGTPNISAADVRKHIRTQYGWKNFGSLDYCRECVADGKAARRDTGFES